MKIGFISLPLAGHLNPMTALARKLQARGNEVVFIGVPDAEPMVRAAGLDFVPFCEEEYPTGHVAKTWGRVAKLRGIRVMEYSAINLMPDLLKAGLEHLQETLEETGADLLALDTAYAFLNLCQ